MVKVSITGAVSKAAISFFSEKLQEVKTVAKTTNRNDILKNLFFILMV
jgi:hypothetical protein